MLNASKRLALKNILNFRFSAGKIQLSNKLLILLASAAGLFSVEAAMFSKATSAAVPTSEPILLAQQPNSRIAILMCGEYDIIIRYLGADEFSYQTRGLYLENGDSFVDNNGDIVYDFFNSDFEYRVATRLDGTGTLRVSKYGETLMTKSCSVEF